MVVCILGQLKKKKYCEEKLELSPRNKKCFSFHGVLETAHSMHLFMFNNQCSKI